MPFSVFVEKRAVKQIENMPDDLRKRIQAALKELEKGFSASLDIKKLKGTKNHYRIRVGNYRILLVIESQYAYIYDVSHRRHVYD